MVGVGGPVQAFPQHGGWDFVPLGIALLALVVLRLMRYRITPVVALVTVLLAPLYRATADATGFPLTVLVTLVVAGFVAASSPLRRGYRPRSPDV
ncbi:MAG TPA: hypothetical protein VH989_11550 [Actinomycetota bacterium]|jgi:hypothetical protein